jgi:RecA/RadA recombinase
MERTNLANQVKNKIKTDKKEQVKEKSVLDGNTEIMISTGSTLLDLAISGGRVRGGGIPGGILVEMFGPSGSGKTVLLSEIAGDVQRKKGEIMFHDPEARLDKQFASIFGLNTDKMNYTTPNTIPEVFSGIRNWEVKNPKIINGIFADSLAALSTNLEMENKDGDKMGMRRAKEFSEELRKTCRILMQKNLLLVCSNQIRQNMDAGPYGQKYISPGGQSIGFYSSLRLRTSNPTKLKIEKSIKGKAVKRIIGITINVEVFKSSVWKPYYTAPVTILFDYGIDDIRENLQYIKRYTGATMYMVNNISLDRSMDKSIQMVEEENLIKELKKQVINLWGDIESKFEQPRKLKER